MAHNHNHDHGMMGHDHMDHAGAQTMDDHSGHGEAKCNGMHMMVFHTSYCQDILFPGWTSTTAGELVGACVVVFLAALLYEGLKYWRESLLKKAAGGLQPSSQVNITKQECGPDSNCSGQTVVKYKMFSMIHLIQTLLHILQVLVSYLLMLIFMTYNVWLCLALLLGTGLGYFLFGWMKQSVVDLNEHCQ